MPTSNKAAKEKSIAPETHVLRPKGEPRTMPPDFSISLGAKGGTNQPLLRAGAVRRQRMRGFDDTYVDIIDYICGSRTGFGKSSRSGISA